MLVRWVTAAQRSLRCLAAVLSAFALLLVATTTQSGDQLARSDPRSRVDITIGEWQSTWTEVLQRYVDTSGRIDFAGLARDPADLDRVVAFVAVVDPTSAPTRFTSAQSRLAYYVDAYNALAMHGVLAAGIPSRLNWLDRVRFFYFQKFMVGGRRISLYDLENNIIRPLGDPRVHFALNCMSVSCPRLPRTAFSEEGLEAQFDAAAREFIGEQRNVQVDPKRDTVRLSAIFNFYTKDFLARAPSLLEYVNRFRVEPLPASYQVEYMDYDWTINAQSHPTQAEAR